MARRDKKGRVLRMGESVRADGKYQFKYMEDGKPKFIYSWRLESKDKLPEGKRPCIALRDLEKEFQHDLEAGLKVSKQKMTVMELVRKYLKTKRNVRQSTKMGYQSVCNFLEKDEFSTKQINEIRVSDAKIFLIRLQEEEGKSYSSIHTIRGVLRPAFQMAVDDDILMKNPFDFELCNVIVNDSVRREAITRKQMRQFLGFVKVTRPYDKFYEGFYILFHTGMRISEFCGLTISDLDFENNTINIERQLHRHSDMTYHIEKTKSSSGTRVIPMTPDVREHFESIIKKRRKVQKEMMVDGVSGFLYLDDQGRPLVAYHWQKRFNHAVHRHNQIYKEQLPNITPHVCRHTYCSNMAKSGMNPKTLQYLMGHSDIGVTMNTYTHLGLDDAVMEVHRLQEQERVLGEFEEEEKGMILKMAE